MKLLNWISAGASCIMKVLGWIEKYFLAICMLFTTGLLFTNVVLRYFFSSAIFWTEEVLRYCIVWITFIGAATCVKEDSHICIDILSGLIKGRSKQVFNIILHVAGIAFGVFFLMISSDYVTKIQATGQVSATIGNMPMHIIYLCLPISAVLYILYSVSGIARNIKALAEKPKEVAEE